MYRLLETFIVERPSRVQDRWSTVTEGELHRAQEAWDAARAGDQAYNARSLEFVAKQAEEEAARRAAHRKFEEERQAAAEAPLVEQARQAFIRSGGSAEAFEQQRAAIIDRVRAEIAVSAAVAAVKPAEPHVTSW